MTQQGRLGPQTNANHRDQSTQRARNEHARGACTPTPPQPRRSPDRGFIAVILMPLGLCAGVRRRGGPGRADRASGRGCDLRGLSPGTSASGSTVYRRQCCQLHAISDNAHRKGVDRAAQAFRDQRSAPCLAAGWASWARGTRKSAERQWERSAWPQPSRGSGRGRAEGSAAPRRGHDAPSQLGRPAALKRPQAMQQFSWVTCNTDRRRSNRGIEQLRWRHAACGSLKQAQGILGVSLQQGKKTWSNLVKAQQRNAQGKEQHCVKGGFCARRRVFTAKGWAYQGGGGSARRGALLGHLRPPPSAALFCAVNGLSVTSTGMRGNSKDTLGLRASRQRGSTAPAASTAGAGPAPCAWPRQLICGVPRAAHPQECAGGGAVRGAAPLYQHKLAGGEGAAGGLCKSMTVCFGIKVAGRQMSTLKAGRSTY